MIKYELVKSLNSKIGVSASYYNDSNTSKLRIFSKLNGDRVDMNITKEFLRAIKPAGKDTIDVGFTLIDPNKYEIKIKRITEQEYSIDAIIYNERNIHIAISKYDYRELQSRMYNMAKDMYLKTVL